MNEDAKLSDLTVAEFRTLMQQCFDADRQAVLHRNTVQVAAEHYARNTGTFPPQPWDEWFRSEQQKRASFISGIFFGGADQP